MPNIDSISPFKSFNCYKHAPSFKAVATGVGRILVAKIITEDLLRLPSIIPKTYSTAAIAFSVTRCLVVPLYEEAFFRKDLKNPTDEEFLLNSLGFGLFHGLLPGSFEQRITHVFTSTVGGLF